MGVPSSGPRGIRVAAVLLAFAVSGGCDDPPIRDAFLNQVERLGAICLGEYIVAQTPALRPGGEPGQSSYLFSLELLNRNDEEVVGGHRLSLRVTGGGHDVGSAAPYVELPASTRIPGRTVRGPGVRRTPVLVTIPAVEGQPYRLDARLWQPGTPAGDDGSECHHRTYTYPG